MPKIDSTQVQLDPLLGIGSKSDVPIVGATDRPLVNVGFRASGTDSANVTAGRAWFNTTLDNVGVAGLVGVVRHGGILASNGGSTTLANSTTDTALGATFNFPANSLVAGRIIRFHHWGRYAAAAGGTMKFDINLGPVNTTYGAVASTAGTKTWYVKGFLTVRTIGPAGTAVIIGQTDKFHEGVVTTGLAFNSTTFDTTIANLFSVNVQFSIANAGNTCNDQSSYIEILN